MKKATLIKLRKSIGYTPHQPRPYKMIETTHPNGKVSQRLDAGEKRQEYQRLKRGL